SAGPLSFVIAKQNATRRYCQADTGPACWECWTIARDGSARQRLEERPNEPLLLGPVGNREDHDGEDAAEGPPQCRSEEVSDLRSVISEHAAAPGPQDEGLVPLHRGDGQHTLDALAHRLPDCRPARAITFEDDLRVDRRRREERAQVRLLQQFA